MLHIIVEEFFFKTNCNSEAIKFLDCKDIIVLSKILLKVLELDKFSLVFLVIGITAPCKKLVGAYP